MNTSGPTTEPCGTLQMSATALEVSARVLQICIRLRDKSETTHKHDHGLRNETNAHPLKCDDQQCQKQHWYQEAPEQTLVQHRLHIQCHCVQQLPRSRWNEIIGKQTDEPEVVGISLPLIETIYSDSFDKFWYRTSVWYRSVWFEISWIRWLFL